MATTITAEELSTYANWAALPRELLLSALSQQQQQPRSRGDTRPHAADTASQPGAAADVHHEGDAALLQRFLQHLASSVPQEWHVRCHRVFAPATTSSNGSGIMPTVHGRAVATPGGLMVFGGLQAGRLLHVLPQHEASWVHSAQPGGLQPDCSTLLQAVPSQPCRQVVRVQQAGSSSSSSSRSGWGAFPCSPALSADLIGHSAVLFGSRAYIFGGMRTGVDADAVADADGSSDAGSSRPRQRCCNTLAAYAVDAAGTQDGLLPVLTEPMPQFGAIPSARMHHSAVVDPDSGVMWVYGGVRELDGARLLADSEPGLLHAFNFATYTWRRVATKGAQRPCSTTLLAFFFHAGALWAIPDLPRQQQRAGAGSSSSSSKRAAAAAPGYQLFRLDTASSEWSLVATQGDGPSQRVEACAVWVPGSAELIVHGGRTAAAPSAMLSDLHLLALHTTPPAWTLVRPRLLTASAAGSSSSCMSQQHQHQQQGATSAPPLAGHAGSVMGSSISGSGGGGGELLFVGGYSRTDDKQGQPQLHVLTRGVKPPTPEAAKLGGAASQQQLARQHVRLAVARLVKGALPKQVHLAPDASGGGGVGVRLPARLLSLYSALFDDLFQGLLEGDSEEQEADSAVAAGGRAGGAAAAAAHVPPVPVPGVSADSIAAVCRWMMGLLTLASCPVSQLVDMYSVADRLVVEALQLEVLEELRGRQLAPHEAAAVMALAGRLQGGVGEGGMTEAGASAEQQLRSAITPASAPTIMELAEQLHGHEQLQARCIEVMQGHRKNDPWAVLAFALRFGQQQLQGSCLRQLRLVARGELLACAERLVRLAGHHVAPPGAGGGSSQGGGGGPSTALYASLADVPLVRMLENDLVQEAEAAGLAGVLAYVGCADRLQLPRLARGLASFLSRPGVWQELHGAGAHANVLSTLQARHPGMYAACRARCAPGSRGPGRS